MKTQPKSAQLESLERARLRLWLRMLKATHLIKEQIRRDLREEFGATLPQFDVMSALARYPQGLKMSEISELLRVSNGNITGIVDRLTEEGLALREAAPGDRRAHLVRMTPKGDALFKQQADAHRRWIGDMLDGFDAPEAAALTERLDRLIHAIDPKGN